jgi:hypothetical protein
MQVDVRHLTSAVSIHPPVVLRVFFYYAVVPIENLSGREKGSFQVRTRRLEVG